jgi:hypothetical protein
VAASGRNFDEILRVIDSPASASVLPSVTISAGSTSTCAGSRPAALTWACRLLRKATAASSDGGPENTSSARGQPDAGG